MQYSIVNYNELNDDFRIDAERYQEKYFNIKNLLQSNDCIKLLNVIRQPVITGHTPSMANSKYYGGDVGFIKTDNLRENEIISDFAHRLSKQGNELLKRSFLEEGDIIVTIIGATHKIVGRTAIVSTKDLPANINQNIALIRVDRKIINPKYVNLFLNTKYGRGILHYESRQTEQVNLNCREIERVIIPVFSNSFQQKIENIVNKAYGLKEQSQTLYKEAKELLLKKLGLLNWKPESKLSYVKSFNDVEKAQRFDAEYFQPKYDEVVTLIEKTNHAILDDIVHIKKSVEVGTGAYKEDGTIPFVRISNLTELEINENNQRYIDEKLYSELSKHQPKKDEILLSKDGTIGLAYHLKDKPKKMIVSGGIVRLSIKDKDIEPEYLTLVLNSLLVRKQIERDSGGAIIAHWLVDSIKNTLIPIIDKKIREKIKNKITESFETRTKSKQLLEIAKRSVEIAIEEDENTATKYINKELKKIGVSL